MAGPLPSERGEARRPDNQPTQDGVSAPKLSRAEFLDLVKNTAFGIVLAPLAPALEGKPSKSTLVFERGRKPLEATISTPDAITSYNLEIAPEAVPEMPDWLQRFIQGAAGVTGLGAEAAIGYYLGIYFKTRRDNPGQPDEVIQKKFRQSLKHPSKRDFLFGAGGAGTLGTLGCGPVAQLVAAFTPPTATPRPTPKSGEVIPTTVPSSTTSPTRAEATKVPEGFGSQSIRTAVTAFREADKITPPYPIEQEVVVIGGTNPIKLRVNRLGNDEFEIGPKGNSMDVKFLPDRVSVLLPFDSLTDRSNGMATIVETAGSGGTKFVNYVVQKAREKGLLTGEESIQYPAAGSSGAALRGHAILVNVLPSGDEWIITSPWLTNKNVVSNWVGKGGEIMVHYKFADGKETDVLLSDLMTKGRIFEVSVDGRYRVDGRSYGRILKEKGIDGRVIDAYEEVFIPPVLKGEWSSRKEGSDTYHDASKAYQFVGSKNYEHAHLLDLQMGTLNVGVITKKEEYLITLPLTLNRQGENVSVTKDPKKLLALKEKYGSMMMNNQGEMTGVQDSIMAVRREIRSNEAWADDIDKNGYKNFFIIVEGGAIAQVIRRTKDESGKEILERFMWDKGKLMKYAEYQQAKAIAEGRTAKPEDLEFQLYSKSPLEVKDGKFWQDGKEIELRGAVTPHFLYQLSINNPEGNLRNFILDVDNLQRLGGNFISLQLNIGEEFVGDGSWKDTLLRACEYAASRGIFVEITARGYGKYKGPDIGKRSWEADFDPINNLDIPAFKKGWNTLWSDDTYAKRLGRSVHIFNPAHEVVRTADRREINWNDIKSLFAELHTQMRERTGKQDLIGAYTAPYWGANIEPILNNPPSGKYDVVEWHPYESAMKDKGRNFNNDLGRLVNLGIPYIVGELGWNNSTSYIVNQYQNLVDVRGSFAYYVLNNQGTDPIVLVKKNGETNFKGYLASVFYGVNK